MPKVENYFVRQSVPSVAGPQGIPISAGGVVGQAAARAFGTASAVFAQEGAIEKHANDTVQLLKAQTDASAELDNLEQTIAADPTGKQRQAEDPDFQPSYDYAGSQFKDTAAEIRSRYLDKIDDPITKVRFQAHFDRLAEAKGITVRAVALKQQVDEGVAGLDDSLDQYSHQAANAGNAAERDFLVHQAEDSITKARDAGFITDVAAGKRIRGFRSKLDEADVRTLIARDPGAAVKALDDNGRFGNLDEIARARLSDMAVRRYEAVQNDQERQRLKAEHDQDRAIEAQRQGFLSDFEIKLNRGDVSYADIEDAYSAGNLHPRDRTRLTLRLDELTKQDRIDQARIGHVTTALAGGGVLDPKSSEDRKAVDAYYQNVTAPAIAGKDPATAFNTIASFAARTGIIPDAARGTIRGSLRSGDDTQAYAAADLIDRIATKNPQTLNDLAEEDVALGKTIMAHVRSGSDPKKAVELARQALAMPPAERKVLGERYKADKLETKNASWIGSEATGGWFSSLPGEIPPLLEGEFQQKTAFNYQNVTGGNIDAARDLALADLKRVWGVSNAGGRARWMKYAPEAMYAKGGDGSWIGEQLTHELDANREHFQDLPEKLDGRVWLEADGRTARESDVRGNPRPSYLVMHLADNGAIEPVRDADGALVRWRPDYASSPAGVQAKAESDARIAELRGQRGTSIDLGTAADALRSGDTAPIDAAATAANAESAGAVARHLEARAARRAKGHATAAKARAEVGSAVDAVLSLPEKAVDALRVGVARHNASAEQKRAERVPSPLRVE